MAVKTYGWISAWILFTLPLIFWDAGYCFMRPRSMKGGDLHWIWAPYALYQEIDLVYGVQALLDGDGFTNAQSLLNIIENLLNILYLYLAHVVQWPAANLVALTVASMTLSKTILYWAQEYYCGFCAIGHNDAKTIFIYWIIPNGLWLLFPSMVIYTLGKDLVSQLTLAQAVKQEVKSK